MILQKEKCKLISDEFSHVETTLFGKKFSYEAHVLFPPIEYIELHCHFDSENMHVFFNVTFDLDFLGDGKYPNCLLSEINLNEKSAKLTMIEVPKHLRNHGLATTIFECWIKVLEKISETYNTQIIKIYGIVGENSNFTPQYSKKLYKHFDNYTCFGSSRLILNHGFTERTLEYTVTCNNDINSF